MNRFLADENFPIPSLRVLLQHGIDVIHVGLESPSIDDENVLELAVKDDRVLLTFDRDHGRLVFSGNSAPPRGIVYFRLRRYLPDEPGRILLNIIESGENFDGFLTLITLSGSRKRALWLRG